MVQALSAMIRIGSMFALLLSIGAIGISRLAPQDRGRTRAACSVVGVYPTYRGTLARGLQLIDLVGGARHSIALGPMERIDLASGSPWVDAWDQTHVAGRWIVKDREGGLSQCGLSRVAYPSGDVLDRVALDRYPVAPPCWGAGTSARVLFVAGDGRLYRYDFEPIAGSGGEPIKHVPWDLGTSETSDVVLLDVMRPDGLLDPDLLLATVLERKPGPRSVDSDRSEIWWLRLNPGEEAIIDCGPVTLADPASLDVGRRRPSLGLRSDGTLCLAYLSRSGAAETLQLRIMPVRIDEQTGTPIAESRPGRFLADGCLSSAPVFVEGGASLVVQAVKDQESFVMRVPLDPIPRELVATMARSSGGDRPGQVAGR